MKLDPLSLRLFIAVVEDGTIAGAAAREHIAAAAVSKRLSELEEVLGTQLLVRTNKGITPTAAGVNLSVLAREVLDGLHDIVARMKDFSDGRRGAVRVLANISAVATFVPPVVRSFNERYPEVHISLQEHDSLAITEGIANNLAEIGIFTYLPHSADIEVYPFRTDELKVIVPQGHALAARDEVTFSETLDSQV